MNNHPGLSPCALKRKKKAATRAHLWLALLEATDSNTLHQGQGKGNQHNIKKRQKKKRKAAWVFDWPFLRELGQLSFWRGVMLLQKLLFKVMVICSVYIKGKRGVVWFVTSSKCKSCQTSEFSVAMRNQEYVLGSYLWTCICGKKDGDMGPKS